MNRNIQIYWIAMLVLCLPILYATMAQVLRAKPILRDLLQYQLKRVVSKHQTKTSVVPISSQNVLKRRIELIQNGGRETKSSVRTEFFKVQRSDLAMLLHLQCTNDCIQHL